MSSTHKAKRYGLKSKCFCWFSSKTRSKITTNSKLLVKEKMRKGRQLLMTLHHYRRQLRWNSQVGENRLLFFMQKQNIGSHRRVKCLPERCFYHSLLVWLMEVATREKGGWRRCYELGMLQDLQLWQKFFAEAVRSVCCLFVCWLHHWWGMAVPLMRCPYCQCAGVHLCQPWRNDRLSTPCCWFGGQRYLSSGL